MSLKRLDVYGNTSIPGVRPRPRAYACTWREACDAVDFVLSKFGHRRKDRGIWVWYCRRIGVSRFLDLAYEVISCHEQGELRFPTRAFHRHLQEALPRKEDA